VFSSPWRFGATHEQSGRYRGLELGLLRKRPVAAVGTCGPPALRLRGLYLALATLARASGMDTVFFFTSTSSSGPATPSAWPAPTSGISSTATARIFVGLASSSSSRDGIAGPAPSAFGRRLLHQRQPRHAYLGVDMTRSKLVVFTLSAGLAAWEVPCTEERRARLVAAIGRLHLLLSLTLLLLAVVGVSHHRGMLLGGCPWPWPVLNPHVSSWWHGAPNNLLELLVGLAAIGVAQTPKATFGGTHHCQNSEIAGLLVPVRGSGATCRKKEPERCCY